MKRTNLPKMLMKEERKLLHICGANRFKQNSKVSEMNYSDIKMPDYLLPSKTGLASRKRMWEVPMASILSVCVSVSV